MRHKWLLPLSLLFALSAFAQEQKAPQKPGEWPLPKINHFDLDLVDRNLQPCDDFYKFVCSKWMAANPIPSDQASWGTSFSSNLQLYNETILRNTLEKAAATTNPDAVHQKIGDYWTSCMNESAIDKSGVKPIQPELDRIASMKSKKELPVIIAEFHRLYPSPWVGGNTQTSTAIFGYGPNVDYNDASLVVGGFDQGGMGMPGREYYLSDDAKMVTLRNKYLAHVQKMFELSGIKPEQAKSDAATVLRMETAMAKVAMDIVKRRDPANLNNVMTLAQVKALAPSFDWAAYLKAVGSPSPKHYLVSSPDFFRGIEPLFKNESLDNWKTYLRWWTLNKASNYLSKPFVDEHFDLYGKTFYGLEENQPRWRRCVGMVDRDLGEALGQAYVDVAFPPESKRRMKEMVQAIEEALGQNIDGLAWMSPQTKKEAQAKLKSIYDKIGYPDKWRDYSPVKVVPDNLVANVHQATSFEMTRQLNKIGKPVDREEFSMTPPTINAYFEPQQNTINFPAGILQPPFFDPEKGDPENYGAIGLVIGHEITHGFDDQGRKFDAKGNLRDWWTPADAKGYDERAACISEAYTHDVPELGVKTNGALTLGEDSADHAGLRIALAALENTYKKRGKSLDEKDSDGYTPRQKFFMGHAFSWCENQRPDFSRLVITTDPHSLSEYRVNYVEKHFPEFWNAFGCKPGQKMVAEKACRIW
ncbi:MAG TPA: M13 family metallopeptidase [Terriglobales bacterium]|nr:M13 family metallopeptidase [Terriglobales bacterium]